MQDQDSLSALKECNLPTKPSVYLMYVHTYVNGWHSSYCCVPLPAEGPREGNQATLLGTHKLHAVLTSGPAFHLLCFIFFLLLPQSANLTISGSGEPAHMSWERKGSITAMMQMYIRTKQYRKVLWTVHTRKEILHIHNDG